MFLVWVPKRIDLQFLELTFKPCVKFFKFESCKHICTTEGNNTSNCFGQPGTPLTVRDGKDDVLVGIAHYVHEDGCLLNFPTVFTKIADYMVWINSTITNYYMMLQ